MIQKLCHKLFLYVLTLLAIVVLNFGLIHLMPGEALVHLLGEEGYAYLSGKGDKEIEAVKAEYGLGESLANQFGIYFKNATTCDWGFSFHFGESVAAVVFERLIRTLMLLIPAVVLGTVLGGWIGAWSGWRSHTPIEKILPVGFVCLYATPAYCLGLLLLSLTAGTRIFSMGILSAADESLCAAIRHMLLPLLVLTIHGTAYKFMIMRNAVRQELEAPYVLTALSKGLSDRRVLFGHILKNALPPYVSVVALNIGFMAGGALLVEIVFSWQGMGTLIYQAVLSRDYPLLSGAWMVISLSVLAANMAADVFYALWDPRIREGGK
jgi:peptide/nickel transport system permease protein